MNLWGSCSSASSHSLPSSEFESFRCVLFFPSSVQGIRIPHCSNQRLCYCSRYEAIVWTLVICFQSKLRITAVTQLFTSGWSGGNLCSFTILLMGLFPFHLKMGTQTGRSGLTRRIQVLSTGTWKRVIKWHWRISVLPNFFKHNISL